MNGADPEVERAKAAVGKDVAVSPRDRLRLKVGVDVPWLIETFERVAEAFDDVDLLSPALFHSEDGSVSVIANVLAEHPTDASARAGELARRALATAGVETSSLTIYVDRGTDDLGRVVLVGGVLLIVGILVGRLARENLRIAA